MASLVDDDESATFNSDNDETMEDADDGEVEAPPEVEAEIENEENEDNDEDEDEANNENQDPFEESPSRPRRPRAPYSGQHTQGSLSNADGTRPGPQRLNGKSNDLAIMKADMSPQSWAYSGRAQALHPLVRPETITAPVYDIVPTIAAPHSTSINTVIATPDMRWVFSGGADGWIRKFNWVDTVNGKSALTVAQRHPFVDSVTKQGVLMSYWENEEPSDQTVVPQQPNEALPLSPVHSLAVHDQALWLLSGTESGPINIQSVRHEEGKRITSMCKHDNAVSVMSLAKDQMSVLSGSWDKSIFDWDLNTGQTKREFGKSSGQISALEMRPASNVPIPQATLQPVQSSNTFSTNTDAKGTTDSTADLLHQSEGIQMPDGVGSPNDSLFGGNDHDSLFGDNDGGGMSGMNFDDDANDELAKALNEGLKEVGNSKAVEDLTFNGENMETTAAQSTKPDFNAQQPGFVLDPKQLQDTAPVTNGLPHAEDIGNDPRTEKANGYELPDKFDISENTFLDASIDGVLRVWDRRRPNPVARMIPQRSVPPWCMHASWSPDGNSIYAGRRNGTVDVYDVHKGLRDPVRSLRFPTGSGPVSAVRAMPNNKHIICASYDILRLYDLTDEESAKHARVPFLIVPGHRTGTVSHLFVDPTCTFMISTGGTRGWESTSTEVLLGYEIGIGR